jgi:outer membrane protein OmpA-like peptidoglycan-associated protein
MKKIIIVSLLASSLSACASLPFMGPPAAATPDTPVFFQPASSSIDQPAQSAIESAAKEAAETPDAPVYVTGASDSVGTTAGNDALSQARASAVAGALEADGVAAARIHIRGAGEVSAPTGTEQSARRVLIRVGG